MKLLFDNITISGKVAVGKNTLLNNLKPNLLPLGWKFRSSGQIVRDYLNENVLPNASLAPDELHHKIDERVHQLLKGEKNWVIEAWLSGFLARDLKNTLRVLLTCHEKQLQIDRVANRDNVSIEKAKQHIKSREEDNMKTFQRLYGDYNFWDPKFYQLIIDTYSSGQVETTQKVLTALGYKNDRLF